MAVSDLEQAFIHISRERPRRISDLWRLKRYSFIPADNIDLSGSGHRSNRGGARCILRTARATERNRGFSSCSRSESAFGASSMDSVLIWWLWITRDWYPGIL